MACVDVIAGVCGQWSCSSLDSDTNTFALPNLEFNDEDIVNMSEDFLADFAVRIFPVPSTLDCGGTVVSVEHCYARREDQVVFGAASLVSRLLILEQNDFDFSITDVIEVHSTPTAEKCTFFVNSVGIEFQVCCDTMPLNPTHQFLLPALNFSFGIVPVGNIFTVRLNENSFPELIADQYRFNITDLGSLTVGETLTPSDMDLSTSLALTILQFIISKVSNKACIVITHR